MSEQEAPYTWHMQSTQTKVPVCWGYGTKGREVGPEGLGLTQDIDLVDCVPCLRMLVKDAVLYGVGRKPNRSW